MGICCTTPEFRPPSIRRKPLVRMCSSGNHFSNFADIGDTVVLFVDFGKLLKPLPRRNQEHSLGGATAGKVWPDQRHRDPEKEQYEVRVINILFSQGRRGSGEFVRIMVGVSHSSVNPCYGISDQNM